VPIASCGDVDLWYDQTGSGPDLVLVAGLADEGASWAAQVERLSRSFRVTTFDNRGVGRSSLPAGDFSIRDMAADTLRLMDALDVEETHLLGSSMGGAIAQELTLAAPGRVRSLVLHGTWAKTDRYFAEVVKGWQVLARGSASQRDFLLAANVWFVAPTIFNEGTIDRWVDEADLNPYAQTVDAFCRTATALLHHDSQDRLGQISCPTMVTVGSLDICTPVRYAEELVAGIRGARLHVFDDVGHMPYVEKPDLFTDAVEDFLTAL
jgi:pimeloyl-ACP methyl ester carboxylesterase